jgi:hypothetical protein
MKIFILDSCICGCYSDYPYYEKVTVNQVEARQPRRINFLFIGFVSIYISPNELPPITLVEKKRIKQMVYLEG